MADSVPSSAAQAPNSSRNRRNSQILDASPSKTTKTAINFRGEYSEVEQAILRRAAEILDISQERLVAAANECRHNPSLPTTETGAVPSTDSDHSEDTPPEGIEPFRLNLPPLAKRRSGPGTSSIVQLHPESQDPNAGHGICDSVLPWLSNFSEPALEVCSELVPFSGGTDGVAGTFYSQWEHDPYNDVDMWSGNNIESSLFFNNMSTALGPVLPISAIEDTPLPSNEGEDFVSPHGERNPVGSSIVPQDVDGDSNQIIEATSADGSSLTSSRGPDGGSMENLGTSPSRHKRKASSSSSGDANSPRIKRRGPFRDAEKLQETNLTRKLVACIRCRMQRIRCQPHASDPYGGCLTCFSVLGQTFSRLPCLRYKISDADLLDHDVCPRPTWTQRWKKMEIVDIKDWRSSEIRTISVTQDVLGTTWDFKVREFTPIKGDSLERRWKTDGVQQRFQCAPYGIANMKEAGKTLISFTDKTLGTSISYYIDETDKLLRNTYAMAYRYSEFAEREEERKLLHCVLRLWCASRMESRSERICGDETLGMKPKDYGPACPNSGNILLPPVLSAQMEVIVTVMILLPMKKAVLRGLQELIRVNYKGSWFTMYLCMFILLHSCALLTAADNKKARKQGLESRFFRTSLVESLHNGAKILLAHFHYCNKGNHPFTIDWSSPREVARLDLNAEQAQFMKETVEQVRLRSERFQNARRNGHYEDELYFLAQLFDRDWKPENTI